MGEGLKGKNQLMIYPVAKGAILRNDYAILIRALDEERKVLNVTFD